MPEKEAAGGAELAAPRSLWVSVRVQGGLVLATMRCALGCPAEVEVEAAAEALEVGAGGGGRSSTHASCLAVKPVQRGTQGARWEKAAMA